MNVTLHSLLGNGTTLLTASRRLAHHLRLQYAEASRAQGLVVWPTPVIVPWSTLLLEASRDWRDASLRPPRLLSDLQALALWERIVRDSEATPALLNPAQAARNAMRSWQRLHQYRLPLEKVADSLSEEARVFASWANEFIQWTARHHWLDGARLGTYLLDSDYRPSMPLRLCGFDQLTPEMDLLLQQWRERGADVALLPRDEVTSSSVQVVAFNDARAELHGAAQWARQQLELGKQHVAVVMANLDDQAAQARRVFTDVFAPDARRAGSEPVPAAFTIATSTSLSSYAIVHHALLLLQLAQGRADTLLVGQLLRSPFLRGYDTEGLSRCSADLVAREARREQWDVRELERFVGAQGCMQLSMSLQRMASVADERGRALPSQWTERFSAMLAQVGWPDGRTLNSDELQTVVKFREVLTQLSALDEVLGRIDAAEAINALRAGCQAARFAPETEAQAVTLIDAETVAGMQFDAMWVMGLHAGSWPAAPQPDAFLPLDLQRSHGMPESSAEWCLQQASRTLQRLVNSAPSIILSWPQHDDDAELQASALLQAWPALSADALPGAGVMSLSLTQFNERPALERFDDTHAPARSPGPVSGGTRSLELQSRCPFKAQAELRLHAKPVPSVSPALEATERGKLVHKVLAEFWQQLQHSTALQSLSEAECAAQLRAIAERIAVREMPATTVHRRRLVQLEVELGVQWIMALLRVERTRAPFTVRQLEQRERLDFAGMQLNIQMDRVDELDTGEWLLIDYKTGNSSQVKDWLDIGVAGRPRSPQLPLYALAHRERLAGISYAVLSPAESAYRGLAKQPGIGEGIEDYSQRAARTRVPGVDDWNALLTHWQSVLESLAHHYLAGDARVDPLKGECDHCHLAALCRINELREHDDAEDSDG